MSRSGYSNDGDNWAMIRWRGAVAAAIRGKRGQKFLKELSESMDAMQNKVIGQDSLQTIDGQYCTLGVIGLARGIDLSQIDTEDTKALGETFDIGRSLAAEIMFMNDEYVARWNNETPEERWVRMKQWVDAHLKIELNNAEN